MALNSWTFRVNGSGGGYFYIVALAVGSGAHAGSASVFPSRFREISLPEAAIEVKPPYRRHGLALALAQKLRAEARERGFSGLSGVVEASNTASLAFCAKLNLTPLPGVSLPGKVVFQV